MSKKIIVANWKEKGTIEEAQKWIYSVAKEKVLLNFQLVVCPPFTILATLAQLIKKENLQISLGAQDVSQFHEGKHTGEVSPDALQELATFVIVGHSERRKDFGETNEIVAQKVNLAIRHNLIPIVCISDIGQVLALKTLLPNFSHFIAYEPLFAIGSGQADTPENADSIACQINAILPRVQVIYGGSVDSKNIALYMRQKNLKGVLVGDRSADVNFFLEVIRNVE